MSKDGIVSAQAIFSVKWERWFQAREKKNLEGSQRYVRKQAELGWAQTASSTNSGFSYSHHNTSFPVQPPFLILWRFLVSQSLPLSAKHGLYVVGRVTVYQVPSYQNVLNSKGAEERETPQSLWENWFLHQVSWSLCVISEEMTKSGSSL